MPDISQITLPDSNTYNLIDATVPHTSETAASGGTTLSLVTTGEKYLWNQAGASSLANLSDVTITTPVNNNILQYDAANNIWVNTDGKADRVPLPAEYDPTSTYAVGDYCTYNGAIYYCRSTISTPMAWDPGYWYLCNAQRDYLHSLSPVGNGSFSLNRRSGTSIGMLSFTEGIDGEATGFYSHAEGSGTHAHGNSAHAEGAGTVARGNYSHAEGSFTNASGIYSHAEGYYTTSSGEASHAEGRTNEARGECSHAEGNNALATEFSAHAEGGATKASGYYSHAEGAGTVANHRAQHVFGMYNIEDPSIADSSLQGNYVEIVGNGASINIRSNARTLDWSGNEELAGTLTTPGCNIQDSSQVTTISLTGSTGDITATSLNGVTIGASPAFTDTTYGLSTSGNDVILSANGTAQDTITVPYATNSGTVNSLTVETAVPASAVFTDTTYSAGTGLSLSGTEFSVKTGYTTSGNNRAVQADSNGNLYVTQKDDNTTYSAGAGLTLSGTTFKTNVPRVTEDARTLPGSNTLTFKEYNSGSSNLPSSAWYYIFSMQGGDTNYGAQLALGMTTTACYYQVKNANTWSGWKSLINTDNNNKVTQSASTTNNNGYELILSGTADNTTRTEGVLKSSRFKSNPANGQTYWYDASRARLYGEPNTGKFEGYNTSGGMNWSLRGDTGQIVCVYVTQGSSRKIKENIKPIEDSEKVLQLQAVSFDYKDKNRGTNKRGFIAEDVAEILPNVTTPESVDTPMGINYTELIPYLQDIVKKQEARISLLEEQIQTLLNDKEENK